MKETLDKIVMDEEKKDEIRKNLLKKKPVSHTWIKVVAAVAAVICAVMIIPFTRNQVLQAAERLFKPIRTKNGVELDIEYNDSNEFVSATINGTPKEYLKVVDDRLILEVEDETIDVTDLCSADDYYRYEVKNDDGTCNLIYVGGTIENYGWVEVVISPDFFEDNSNQDHAIGVWFTGGSAKGFEELPEEQPKWEEKAFADGEAYMASLK